MIQKKKGIINNVVYNNTVYNKGQNRYYPTINDLFIILDKIIDSQVTTNYIRITPFYCNFNRQIEFDDYVFYLECRDDFSKYDLKRHIEQCMDREFDISHDIKRYEDMSDEEKLYASIMYPICKKSDIADFQSAIYAYKKYILGLISVLFKEVKDNFTVEEYPLGYFCFEIHSG